MFIYLEVNFKFLFKNKINECYFFKTSNLCCSSRSSTRKFNHVLAIDHVYENINLLKYFYILATSHRTHCKIISLKKKLVFKFKIIY